MNLLFKIIRIFTFNYLPWRKKNTLTVFLFHAVNDTKQTFYPSISSATYEKVCLYIQKHYSVIHFNEVNSYISKNNKPAAIISFDDGMKDLVKNVLPFMKQHNLKFNINIDTEILETKRPQRFVQVYDILNFGKNKTSFFDEKWMKEPITIDYQYPHITEAKFTALLSSLNLEAKKELINSLISSFEFDESKFTHVISVDDLISLSKEQLVEIGSHSHTHPDFTYLSEKEVIHELKHSKEILEKIIERDVNIIAYPNGQHTENIDKLAKHCGYQIILKTEDKINQINKNEVSFYRIHEYHNDVESLLAHSFGIIKLIKKILP